MNPCTMVALCEEWNLVDLQITSKVVANIFSTATNTTWRGVEESRGVLLLAH